MKRSDWPRLSQCSDQEFTSCSETSTWTTTQCPAPNFTTQRRSGKLPTAPNLNVHTRSECSYGARKHLCSYSLFLHRRNKTAILTRRHEVADSIKRCAWLGPSYCICITVLQTRSSSTQEEGGGISGSRGSVCVCRIS